MSTYLLLRDNKQSGPYSLDDIRLKGFKKYDLVWIEGKSAAWRYPGEIEELKPFAPIVEEQPFDRFFKKPSASEEKKETKFSQEQATKKQPEKVAVANQVAVEIGDKKIFASMPAKKLASAQQQRTILIKPAFKKEEEKPAPTPVATADFRYEKKYVPLAEESIATKSPREKYTSKKTSVDYRRYSQLILLTACVAALLGAGIFIGMSINKNAKNPIADKRANETAKIDKPEDVSIPISTSVPLQNNNPVAQRKNDVAGDASGTTTQENKSGGKNKIDASAGETKKPSKNKERIISETSKITPESNNATDSNSSLAFVQRQSVHRTDAIDDKGIIKNAISTMVSVTSNKYNVGTFGGISELQLTVNNKSIYPLDVVMVEVQYIQANKKVYKTENIYYRNVRPGESMMQEVPKSPRGVKIQYRVALINSKEPSVSYSGT